MMLSSLLVLLSLLIASGLACIATQTPDDMYEEEMSTTSVLLSTVQSTLSQSTSSSTSPTSTSSSSTTTTTTTTTSTTTSTTTTSTTSTVNIICDNVNWIPNYSNGFCYYAWPMSNNFAGTKTECMNAAMDGDLASILSPAEQDFVYNNVILASGYPIALWWIGLMGVDMIPYTIWLDGKPYDYTNWDLANGEPNGMDTTDRCVAIKLSDGLWIDTSCSGTPNALGVCKAPGIVI